MKLYKLLTNNKKAIVDKWGALIFDTYPSGAVKFLAGVKDQFRNPLGCTISRGVVALFDCLLEDADKTAFAESLDEIIRVRAVQDLTASQATGFIFLLKQAIRDNLTLETEDGELLKELLEFESRIDRLALMAFDNYMHCREQIHQIRMSEVKKRSLQVLERRNSSILIDPTDNTNLSDEKS